ncbi:site-specific integrase [Bradyrhizobium retamae]|nr:site-specific integrase [Bradyrhizobium retamae]
MSIIEPAFGYLLELSTIPGRSHATETLRTYSEHLHDWFDSLEQSGLDWRLADEGTIAAYRNRMLSTASNHTGRPYARSTVNDRVRTVCRFYSWAHRRGLIDTLPFDYVDVSLRSARQGMLAHLGHHRPVIAANVLTISEAERLPRPLREERRSRGEEDRRHVIAGNRPGRRPHLGARPARPVGRRASRHAWRTTRSRRARMA